MLTLFGPLNLLSKIAGGFLIGALLFVSMLYAIERRGHAKAIAHIVKLVAAREADRRAYEAAQVKAAELNRTQVKAIETQQQRITANVEADLTSRLERLRSELRSARHSTPQGSAGHANPGQASGGSQAAPDTSQMCISTDQYVLGAEYEEKLDQWITWYEQQRQIQR